MHATNFLVAVVLGAAVSIYIPMISRASSIMGSPILGSIPYFAVGLVTSIAIAAMSGFRTADFFRVDGVPPWLFLAGVVSAVAIIITSFLIPRIGPGALFVLLVTGQILFGAFLGHFGLLGVPTKEVSLQSAAGIILVIAGATLFTFGSQDVPQGNIESVGSSDG